MTDRVVVGSPGGWGSVSTRYRLEPVALHGGLPIEAISAGSFPTRPQVDALLAASGPNTTLILQRVLPRAPELSRLRAAYTRLIFDMDDAIYAVPPSVRGAFVQSRVKGSLRLLARGSSSASSRRRPLVRVLRSIDVCVVGNSILGDFARRHAPRVVEIPTTVRPVPAPARPRADPPILVWMGLPDNLQYLELLRKPLTKLREERDVKLRIISAQTWADPPLPVEFVQWSEEAARDGLLGSTIGLAPLTDDPWTRGKCALRAIQYGAHGLPTVASPVGITDRVISHGETGLLARSSDEWLASLRELLADPDRTAKMGARAHARVSERFSDKVAVAAWSEVLAE